MLRWLAEVSTHTGAAGGGDLHCRALSPVGTLRRWAGRRQRWRQHQVAGPPCRHVAHVRCVLLPATS